MSNRPNHRRDEGRRTEHGPRYESHNPGKGCNSTHVARGRKKFKRRRTRADRRRLSEFNGCDHEFADTAHCIRCGWVPEVSP